MRKENIASLYTALLLLVLTVQYSFSANSSPIASSDYNAIACSPDQPTAIPSDTIKLRVWLKPQKHLQITHRWTVSGGHIISQGLNADWFLKGLKPGQHYAQVIVTDQLGMKHLCKVSIVVKPSSRGKSDSRESGWSFLVSNKESPGYGLYSYILFGSKPTQDSIDRYKEVIETYLLSIPRMTDLENELLKYGVSRLDLNINYLILKRQPDPGQALTADWVINNYDYVRARVLLRNLKGDQRDGPYIVSSLTPFYLDGRLSTQFLYQDLSYTPVHIVSVWAREFFNQAAQERFWETTRIKSFALKLRQTVALLGIALPGVLSSVDDWIKWVKRGGNESS